MSSTASSTRLHVELRDDGFVLDGIRFIVSTGSKGLASGPDGVVLLKPWDFVEQEYEVLASLAPKRLLEVGVFEGGGAVLWPRLLDLDRYVGLDRRDLDALRFPAEATDDRHWATVRFVGDASQADPGAIAAALSMLEGPLDAVIDDASHQYELSTRTFELCFPHLIPGGAYVIEDWNWAHGEGPWQAKGHPWHGAPSLSNLVLRIVLLAAERRDLVSRVDVRPNFVVVWRGSGRIGGSWTLDASIVRRPLKAII